MKLKLSPLGTKPRGQLYERNWFTFRPYQKSDRSFTWVGGIVNSSINKALSYMSPDWFTSPNRSFNLSKPQMNHKWTGNVILD